MVNYHYPVILRAAFGYKNPLQLLSWKQYHIDRFIISDFQVYDWKITQYRPAQQSNAQIVKWLQKSGYFIISARLAKNHFDDLGTGVFVITLVKNKTTIGNFCQPC